MKQCKICANTYDENLFYKNSKSKDWLESKCKHCREVEKKIYYSNNKDKWINCWKYRTNEKAKEYYRVYWQNKRAKKRYLSDGTINVLSISELLQKQNNKCNICSKDISKRIERHLDHIYPLSKWWPHSISNVQWLCCKCNLQKSNLIL